MKDLMTLATECIADMTALGIPIRKVRSWTVSTRGKNMWGQCKAAGKGIFDIRISQLLLQDGVDDQAAKNTIAHELLHTVEGCMNHGQRWHRLAAFINSQLPQYNIRSRTPAEEKGIQIEYRYLFRCTDCGNQIGRHKKSRFVEHYDKYICSKCGGKFKRIQ